MVGALRVFVLALSMVSMPNAYQETCDRQVREVCPVYFNSLLTPQWLADHAQIYEKFSFSSGALLFKDGSADLHRLIRVRLVKPGLLRDDGRYLVTITLSHVSPISPTADMDLYLYLSDGVKNVGNDMLDAANYATLPPLRPCEADSGVVAATACNSDGPRVNNGYSLSPQVITFTHSVGGHQVTSGEAHATYDRTISVVHTYTNILQPRRGLYLDIHRDNKGEQYLIKFVKVKVEEEVLP
jgi:hypothetical protein